MTLLYFAQARQLAGVASEALEISEPMNADALWAEVLARHPGLSALRSATRLARNGEFAAADAVFQPGDEVALISPVSGG
jgi:molybdopterin converting factor subunit 1